MGKKNVMVAKVFNQEAEFEVMQEDEIWNRKPVSVRCLLYDSAQMLVYIIWLNCVLNDGQHFVGAVLHYNLRN